MAKKQQETNTITEQQATAPIMPIVSAFGTMPSTILWMPQCQDSYSECGHDDALYNRSNRFPLATPQDIQAESVHKRIAEHI